MTITIRIVDGPLQDAISCCGPNALIEATTAIGATITFEGIVRAFEGERQIRALDYEAYEPMASQTLAGLAQDILDKHGLNSILIEHSRGQVPVGGRSFRFVVQSAHRKEALAATEDFINRMKCDVPIWKSPIYA
ncbi:MAG: molybdenum cofactor biosynthesis protein MoaE [Planctomycetota bacterium]|nr:molybdenum cofactor biosynthesis protein MoaE [Planctomycetota bacterium]MDA1261436.1 molybdenum cofactor biosynthesis protein MoaE [Planctomycetota bacterium]